MFEPRGSFARDDNGGATRFVATWERVGFRPWMSDHRADTPAGEDADPDDGDFLRPLDADGADDDALDSGTILRDAALRAAIDAAARIAAAADRFEPCCETALAALLAETVARLMHEMFEISVTQTEHLERRALQLARLVQGEIDPVRLRLHPDDFAMMADAPLPWPMLADATLDRGEIRLETQEGGIADSPAERIERLRRRIAGEVTQ